MDNGLVGAVVSRRRKVLLEIFKPCVVECSTMYMIYIFIVVFAMMVWKSFRKRAMGRYVWGNLDIDIDLGMLAAKTVILGVIDTVIDRTLVSSVVVIYSLFGVISVQLDGSVEVGVVHSDYILA